MKKRVIVLLFVLFLVPSVCADQPIDPNDPFIQDKMILDLPELSGFTFVGMWQPYTYIDLRYQKNNDIAFQRSEYMLNIFNSSEEANNNLNSLVNNAASLWNMSVKEVNGNKILEGTSKIPIGEQRYLIWVSGKNVLRGWNGDDEGRVIDDALFDVLTNAYLEKYPSTSGCGDKGCSTLNVQHSVAGTKVTITYDGTGPFLINIRGDTNIGQPGGFVWAKTNSNSFSYDLSFADNPSGKFYFGVKDTEWSTTSYFTKNYSKFSARVYPIDPLVTPETKIVTLNNLDGSGYLRGKYVDVQVARICSVATQTCLDRVYSPDNVFVYEPVEFGQTGYWGDTEEADQGRRFDQVMSYYGIDAAATYLAKIGGWTAAPQTKVFLFEGSSTGSAQKEGIYGTAPVENEPNGHRDVKGSMHEYVHSVYFNLIGWSSKPALVLSEGYAIYLPCSITNTSKYSNYLNPPDPKDLETYVNRGGEDDMFSFASALWDIRKEFGQEVTDRLVYRSWEIQAHSVLGRFRSFDDGLTTMTEADWELYNGVHRATIVEKFKEHGFVCENCKLVISRGPYTAKK